MNRILVPFAVLALVVAAALIPTAWLGHRDSGVAGIHAALLAAIACLSSSIVALALVARFAGTPQAIAAMFGGIGIRTGVPLLTAVILSNTSPSLREAGIFGMCVVFYLLTLVVETWFAVGIVNASNRSTVRESTFTGSESPAGDDG